MITILAVIVGVLGGYEAGTYLEWRRVLRYLDSHLDRDPDWLRSGIEAEHHTRRKAPNG